MSNKSPLEFFDLLVSRDIIENITLQTNIYASQYFDEHSSIGPRSRLHCWKKKLHTTTELLQFLALMIHVSCSH